MVVLIAEDERPIAEVVTMVVEDAGHTPLVASHGRQALELARNHWPALVITDLMMPFLSGQELIAALQSEAEARGMRRPPVILMTAMGGRRARATGADAVLPKPFDVQMLEELLHQFLVSPGTSPAGAGPADRLPA